MTSGNMTQALPPGSSGALRAEYDGPGSPPAAGASPGASRASTPYAYGGNGHFAPSPPKASPGAARAASSLSLTSLSHESCPHVGHASAQRVPADCNAAVSWATGKTPLHHR